MNTLRYAIVYLAGITLAELLTSFVQPQFGLAVHGLLLVSILLHASFSKDTPQHGFLLTLSIAPLIRLLSLTMPVVHFAPEKWYLIIGAPLFLVALIVGRLIGITRQQLGLTLGNLLWLQITVVFSGLLLGFVEYYILRPEPLVPGMTWQQFIAPVLILLIFTGLLEEIVFRGLMQATAITSLGRWGIPYMAVLFAVMHIGYRSILDVSFVFGVGLLFGWVTKQSGSILGASMAHGLANISLFLIYPFLLN